MIAQNIARGMRLIPNGVFVVASSHDGETHGFTATWVSQASYRNPLLTVAVDKGHDTYKLIQQSGQLVCNQLTASQVDVAEHFGHRDRPPQSEFFREENGQQVPVLKDCLAAIFCRVVDTLDARDHVVLLVEAIDSQVFSAEPPLLYSFDRGYVALRESKA